MDIRALAKSEQTQAIHLVWTVFLEFEAPEYAPEGVEEFRRFLNNEDTREVLKWWGAFDRTNMIGVLAMRGTHICLFFVEKERQQSGVGRALFQRIRHEMPDTAFTVNSSPYAVNIYRRMGFAPTDAEQVTNGIRYTPMVWHRT